MGRVRSESGSAPDSSCLFGWPALDSGLGWRGGAEEDGELKEG